MKRKQLVERIAEAREVPLHTAADWLDAFLHDLLRQMKNIQAPAEADNYDAQPQPPPCAQTTAAQKSKADSK